ncbi:MAG TPA: DUF5666 domain-containing protein, partial [Burkholderiaceae bacterium]|nr:DUF5666 domain-containing protein [Burkholderiaceae bacterium]
MNRHQSARASWTRRLWIAVSVCLGVLAACGGGVGTGGTGAFASGPISGFGSIIVNDVVYDDTLARIEDDTGSMRARADLGLGTVVEVDSDAVRNDAATASRVRITSERIGRVDAVAADRLTVNGLPVRFNAGTVFDASFGGGAAGIAVGTVVEVHGFATGTPGEVLATRIEPRNAATSFKFRAAISALDTQARTFRIGNQTFAYALGASGRDLLAEGAFLRVWVSPTRDLQGRWVVTEIARGQSMPPDNTEVKTNGLITLFASTASFQVGPWGVDASGATIQNGPLAVGQRVKISGRVQGGVLVASDVRVLGPSELQMTGTIATVDPVARIFEFSGRRDRVSFARNDIVFENGSASSLTVGRRVRAFGQLSADGTLLEAT